MVLEADMEWEELESATKQEPGWPADMEVEMGEDRDLVLGAEEETTTVLVVMMDMPLEMGKEEASVAALVVVVVVNTMLEMGKEGALAGVVCRHQDTFKVKNLTFSSLGSYYAYIDTSGIL